MAAYGYSSTLADGDFDAQHEAHKHTVRYFLCINAWYGRGESEVEIVKETTKRYLVRGMVDGTLIPGGRRLNKGDEVYVPKSAIKRVEG